MSHTSGGRVSTVIDGIAYSARGEITISGSNMETTSGANMDGTVYRTVAAKVLKAEITFDRFVSQLDGSLLRWNQQLMLVENMSVTFVEQDGKQTHMLTGAFFEGTPAINLATGEVSGMTIAADSYKTIDN